MKKSPARDINTHIQTLTEGIITKVTDYVLAELYFRAVGKRTAKPRRESPALLSDRILTTSMVSRALAQLNATGMVQRIAEGRLPTITYLGRERLKKVLPVKNPGTGTLYLTAYDIPRTGNVIRNRIRESLLEKHAVSVLDSLWISPVDPTDLLTEAVGSAGGGSFFITTVAPDATVNGKPVRTLIEETWNIGELALKYDAFLAAAKDAKTPSEYRNARYLYLSAVKADPGLPDSFLPKGFPAEKAAKKFAELSRK